MFLIVLAVALSIPMAMQGSWLVVAGMAGAIFIFLAVVALIEPVAELAGRRALHAIHENGIVWRRAWMRGFIPWSDIAAVHQHVFPLESRGAF